MTSPRRIHDAAVPPTMGIRHVALRVRDLEGAERFYSSVLGYRVEWRPDPDNLYLSAGSDNLALHRDPPAPGGRAARDDGRPRARDSALDHFGILLRAPKDVDAWARHLKSRGVALKAGPRSHRDGARSFYALDPEGNVIQFLYHPPISSGSRRGSA